ncbi:MAG: alpha-D-ribose 1-methylphosphonate 5-triphosphate diphosphatase [Pseudonocardia sp.]
MTVLPGVTLLAGGGAPPMSGTATIDGGTLAEFCPGEPGDLWLVPAAVDVHLDVVGPRRRPRAGVVLDLDPVLAAVDAECAGAGVGTVCIAARFEDSPAKSIRRGDGAELCAAVERLAPYLACDWRVHARVEVTDAGAVDELAEALAVSTRVALVSVMELSAERTRFGSAEAHLEFYAADWGVPAAEVEATMATARAGRAAAGRRRAQTAALARAHGVALATHDDREPEHVEEGHALGATIAEFPLTTRAAARARELGMCTVLGAPNALRGRSTAGNLLVRDAVAAGLVDVLGSDYLPAALVAAPFALAGTGRPAALADLVDLVAAGPAAALGLPVPQVAVGAPLDATLVRLVDGRPLPVTTWRRGVLTARRAGASPVPAPTAGSASR